ncbi:MAG: spermine/spermidine synthase domain-containing protein [Thiobacillus sp.]
MNDKAMSPSTPLLEIPGRVAGEAVTVRVLEPAHSDPARLYEKIQAGRYPRPFIIDDGETRQLLFGLDFIQSSMRIDEPYALDFAYTRKMMAFLLFVPDPGHVLMVGLGGGSLAKFCHRHLPRARLTVVEVDPDVIALRGEFDIPDDPRLAIVQADAADYLPAAEGDTDVLLLDGFDCNGIAPAFLSRGFYRMARRRLRPGGLLVANFAGPRKCWSRHLAFLNEAFDGQVQLGTVPGGDNHIAFAFDEAGCAIDWQQLEAQAALLADRFPLDFPAIVASLREGAELRWAKAASAKALPTQQTKESHPCTKSTPT